MLLVMLLGGILGLLMDFPRQIDRRLLTPCRRDPDGSLHNKHFCESLPQGQLRLDPGQSLSAR